MKIKTVIFYLILFGIFGYLRERFFEHMNIIMASVYRGTDEYANLNAEMPAIMSPFSRLSYPVLYYSKYLFTVIWAAIFYLISYFALKHLVADRKIIKYLNYTYLIMFTVAAISMIYGYFTTHQLRNDEYTLSRWLMGIAQSPIICLILTASGQLYKKSFNHDTKR